MQGFSKLIGAAAVAAGLVWCGTADAQVPPPPRKKPQPAAKTAAGAKVQPAAKPVAKPAPAPAKSQDPAPKPQDPAAKPQDPKAAAAPAQPAKPLTPEEEAAKKKAEEEARQKAEEAKKKQQDQKRLQQMLRLKFDRRPAAMLKAWATPTEEEKKRLEKEAEALAKLRGEEPKKAKPAAGAGGKTPPGGTGAKAPAAGGRMAAGSSAGSRVVMGGRATAGGIVIPPGMPPEMAEALMRAAAEGGMEMGGAAEAGGPEEAPKDEFEAKLKEELEQFQRDVTLGQWEPVAKYLAAMPEEDAEKAYHHLCKNLNLDHERQARPPQPGQLKDGNLFSPADLFGLADAAPADITDEALTYLAGILRKTLAQGHSLDAVVEQWKHGTQRLGGDDPKRRLAVAGLLVNAGHVEAAANFLPDAAKASETGDYAALALLVRYYVAKHAADKEPELLENAWMANQAVLATKGLPEEAKATALTAAVDLAPQVKEVLGEKWLEQSFTGESLRGREILATIGSQVAAARLRLQRDGEARRKALELQHTVVEALVKHNAEQADGWKDVLTLLCKNWMHEVEYSLVKDEDAASRRQFRRDAYGNVYYSRNFYRGQNSRDPVPVPSGELLEMVPGDGWLARVAASLKPRIAAVRARLHLKVHEDEEAFPFIETLAETRPAEAHELAEAFLRVWIDNHDMNSNSGRTRNYYMFMWGFEQRAESIPLTRSKQERDLKRLAHWIGRIRALPIDDVDDELLAEAFIRTHSAAEVYRLSAIEQVFGPVDDMKDKTLARLVEVMRTNLAGLWRDPRVQKAKKTKRTDREIQAQVLRGYQVATELVDRGLRAFPASWRIKLAAATVVYDRNYYERKEVSKSADFAKGRDAAYGLYRQAADAYASVVKELRADELSTDVYDRWFYASLGAADLPRVAAKQNVDVRQAPAIRAAIDALPDKHAGEHLGRFATNLFTRMSSAKPDVKFNYLKQGFRIVGDHKDAREARQVYTYYNDLVTEIALETKVDGSDRVGHGEPFGLFVNIRHTVEIERESGGFGKYLQNQNTMNFSYNYGRPTEDYRDKFEEAAREVLEEHFEVLSMTFHEPSITSRGTEQHGWRVTPYAYILLKPKGAEVDKVPPLEISFDFLDTSGYAIIPVESPAIPIDATPKLGDARPVRGLEITQTLDERQAGDGKLVLEIKAQGQGLVPPLEQLLQLQYPGFEEVKRVDNGVAASRLDPEAQENTIVSERTWDITLQGQEGQSALPKEFTFGTAAGIAAANDDTKLVFQRYNDADLAEVTQKVPLQAVYGTTGYGWVWVLLIMIVIAVPAIWYTMQYQPETQTTQLLYEIPAECTAFSVINLLERIHADGRLPEAEQARLKETISDIERTYFGNPDAQPGAASTGGVARDLESTARDWAHKASQTRSPMQVAAQVTGGTAPPTPPSGGNG
ncbi:MAG: hypothetical protein ACYTGX_11910, partial [Planctomycetota bacterium]